MDERREIKTKDFDESYAPHVYALDSIKNYNFIEIEKAELLSIIKNNLFIEVDVDATYDLFSSMVVNEMGEICLNCCLIKNQNEEVQERYYVMFTPFEVWVKTTSKIYYRNANLTNDWCKYLLRKYPLYLSALLRHLGSERARLHNLIDMEFDEKLRELSITV